MTGTLYEGSAQLTGSESLRQEFEVNPTIRGKQQDSGPTYNRTVITEGAAWAATLEVQSALWPPATATGSDDSTFGAPGLNMFSPRTRLAHSGKQTIYSIAHTDDAYLPQQTYRSIQHTNFKKHKKFIVKHRENIEKTIAPAKVDLYMSKTDKDDNKSHMSFAYQSTLSEHGAQALNGIHHLEQSVYRSFSGFAPDWKALKKETKNINKLKSQILKDEKSWEPLQLDTFFNRTEQSSFRGLNYVLAAQSRKGASIQRRIYSTQK